MGFELTLRFWIVPEALLKLRKVTKYIVGAVIALLIFARRGV